MHTAITSETTITTTAPPAALCARCGCRCGGATVTATVVTDPIAGPVIRYEHLTETACLMAEAQSEAFWFGDRGAR